MNNIDYKKILDKNNSENSIIHVVLRADDNKEYECVGVLMKEEKDTIYIAFNAKNDEVKDYLPIKKVDIISINIVDDSEIKELS